MPDHEEHCLHSEKRYGVRGDEIHAWIDEPSQVSGGTHREYRHNLSSLQTAIQLFGKLYGADMVENIFLDHLKADSEEKRKRREELEKRGISPKRWTAKEDKYLIENFLLKTDGELEAELEIKSRSAIAKRRKYLGLVRPRILKRTKKSKKVQRLVFRLERGKKFFMDIGIDGGKKDIDFWMTASKNKTTACVGFFGLPNAERVFDGKKLEFCPEVTDNYYFYFSNSFSVFSTKHVKVSYQLENGKKVSLNFSL
jgi:hypothetical protein